MEDQLKDGDQALDELLKLIASLIARAHLARSGQDESEGERPDTTGKTASSGQ